MKKSILALVALVSLACTGRAFAAWQDVRIVSGPPYSVTVWINNDNSKPVPIGGTIYSASIGGTIYSGQVGATIYSGQIGATIYAGQVGATIYSGQIGGTIYSGQVGATIYSGSICATILNTADQPLPITGTVTGSVYATLQGGVTVYNSADQPVPITGTVTGQMYVTVQGGVTVYNSADQPVPITGTVYVSNTATPDNPAFISGTVYVSNTPDQAVPVTGTVTGSLYVTVQGGVTVYNTADQAVPVTGSVYVSNTANQAVPITGTVSVAAAIVSGDVNKAGTAVNISATVLTSGNPLMTLPMSTPSSASDYAVSVTNSATSVTGTAVLFATHLWLYNNGGETIWLGGQWTRSYTGVPLAAGASTILDFTRGDANTIYAISASGTVDVRVMRW